MLLMEVKEVKGVSSLCSHQGKLKDNSFAVRFKAEKYKFGALQRAGGLLYEFPVILYVDSLLFS